MLSSLALELNSLSVHLVRWARRADESLGVPPARLSALSVLVFGGARTMSELATVEQVSLATISRVVDGLAASGLARRVVHPSDARSWVVKPTAKGRRLMEKGRAARVDVMQSVLHHVPREERATVERALVLLRAALTEAAKA